MEGDEEREGPWLGDVRGWCKGGGGSGGTLVWGEPSRGKLVELVLLLGFEVLLLLASRRGGLMSSSSSSSSVAGPHSLSARGRKGDIRNFFGRLHVFYKLSDGIECIGKIQKTFFDWNTPKIYMHKIYKKIHDLLYTLWWLCFRMFNSIFLVILISFGSITFCCWKRCTSFLTVFERYFFEGKWRFNFI